MIGIGLRHAHFADALIAPPAVDFLEIHAENFFSDGGYDWHVLDSLRRDYALSCHGVGLSLASADGLCATHLDQLARLVARIEPRWVSEHLCWGSIGGHAYNDLLPFPFTEEALALVVRHVDQVQTRLRHTILVENVSRYVSFTDSSMSEAVFLRELCRRSGCAVLLDVNNLYVNQVNHGVDALTELAALANVPVGEIHIAGYTERTIGDETLLIDTHAAPVSAPVWELYRAAARLFPGTPALLEWDNQLPSLDVLVAEAAKAGRIDCALTAHKI